MVPLLYGAMIGANGLASLYHVGKTIDSVRYWRDYQKNTGYKPKYPYRAGVYDGLYDTADTLMNAGFSYGYCKRL